MQAATEICRQKQTMYLELVGDCNFSESAVVYESARVSAKCWAAGVHDSAVRSLYMCCLPVNDSSPSCVHPLDFHARLHSDVRSWQSETSTETSCCTVLN